MQVRVVRRAKAMPETSERPYESTGSVGLGPCAGTSTDERGIEIIDTRPERRGRHLTKRQCARIKLAFLAAYSKYGNMSKAARMADISRNAIYDWLETDQEFAQAFRTAEAAALEYLEAEAWRRAVEGSPYERTSYWHGEPVGTDRKIEYSDQLLTLLLRARAPEKYRDRMDVAVSQVIKTVAGVDPASVL